jgi:hypothetical protein
MHMEYYECPGTYISGPHRDSILVNRRRMCLTRIGQHSKVVKLQGCGVGALASNEKYWVSRPLPRNTIN